IRVDFGNEIVAWLRAVTLAEKGLSFEGVASCLSKGSKLAGYLRDVSWFARLGSVDAAVEPAHHAIQALEPELATGIGYLFRDKLKSLLTWAQCTTDAERRF